MSAATAFIVTPFISPPPLSRHGSLPIRPPSLLPLSVRHHSSSPAPKLLAGAEVDMVRGRDGVWSARRHKVSILWDLDNKPPRGAPYDAAAALRRTAELLGDVADITAFANRHTFSHLPQRILHQRRDRRRLDDLERKGLAAGAASPEPYLCGVCGRKLRTNLDLKRHFKQIHQREREKKLARMRSMKGGKKREKYKERFISGNVKYEETARGLLAPSSGYGLSSELRRAGVAVKTVSDKPQAADWEIKRQMQVSMARRVDWLVLVSDDSDFSETITRARESDLRTVVVGDRRRDLARRADLWVPWARVEDREVSEEVLFAGRNEGFEEDDEDFDSSFFYEDVDGGDFVGDLDDVFASAGHGGSFEISEFIGSSLQEEDFLWEGSDEDDDYYVQII